MSDLKLAVGQVWETLDDDGTVSITDIEASGEFPVIGTFTDKRGRKFHDRRWSTNGGYDAGIHGETGWDLVKLLTPAPIDLTEQTIETFAKIARNGGKVPDGMKQQSQSHAGAWLDIPAGAGFIPDCNYRLVPITPPKPEMVPLERADVIVNKTRIRTAYGEAVVLSVNDNGISYASVCPASPERAMGPTVIPATWVQMQKHATYSNDDGQTWQRCEKATT